MVGRSGFHTRRETRYWCLNSYGGRAMATTCCTRGTDPAIHQDAFPFAMATLGPLCTNIQVLTEIFRFLLVHPKDFNDDGLSSIDKRVKPGCTPTGARDVWLSRVSFLDMRDGRHHLVPVSRVCTLWNKIANQIMYEQIQVDGSTCQF